MPSSHKPVLLVIAFIATVLTLGVVDISELDDPIAAIGSLFVFLIENPRIGVSVLVLIGIIVFIGTADRQ